MKAEIINKNCMKLYGITVDDYLDWCAKNKKKKSSNTSKRQFMKEQMNKNK